MCSYCTPIFLSTQKRAFFVSCNGPKIIRVNRSVKIFFWIILSVKNVFHACFTLIGSWEGKGNFRVGISLNKNLLW